MSKFCILMFFVLAAHLLCSCEKVYIGGEEEEDGKEHVDGNDNDGDDDTPEWDFGDIEHAGGGDGEFATGDIVDVYTFKNYAIYTQVWVKGYIVGAATGKNGKYRYEFGPEFSYDTAILLADTPDADSLDEVISVCLTNCSKYLRAKLNLYDHPENKGRRIALFGFQGTYLKIMGMKKIDSYEFPLE